MTSHFVVEHIDSYILFASYMPINNYWQFYFLLHYIYIASQYPDPKYRLLLDIKRWIVLLMFGRSLRRPF